VELGYDADGLARGRALVARMETDALLRDLAAARDAVSAAGKVGTVGYCYGGSVVWMMAAKLDGLACGVSYYGSRIVQLADLAPKVPVLMHVGREDSSFPLEKAREIAARASQVTLCEWQAGHGFNCDQRADYRPEVAAAALERTLAFLREHVC
jgi:carboxymethylenebutenolidase